MPKKKQVITTIEVSPGVVVSVGDMVRFHRNGWRCGHLESIDGALAKIRPVAPRGRDVRTVNVPLDDITAL